MCATCGCDSEHVDHVHPHGHGDSHAHGHTHAPEHGHVHAPEHGHARAHASAPASTPVSALSSEPAGSRLARAVLEKNDRLAAQNRAWFAARGILALNLVSSPGAGKTTLLERTIRDRRGQRAISVVEGDQATTRDADRIRAAGARAVQVNTGSGCHLDAAMVERALSSLDPPAGSLLMIENVGNLVCPALFDLGERAKVVVASVTEGDDKPIKYPHMFRAAGLVLLNKVDLLAYVEFDVDRFRRFAREVNPRARVVAVSATRGDGLDEWYGWLEEGASSPLPQGRGIA
jgi:hydrogenase nickel incorporation protein HypB